MLRVIQLNVARFSGGIKQITHALKSIVLNPKASVICLNEVDLRQGSDALRQIASACLEDPHISFFGHVAKGMYGNAILSSFPFDEKASTKVHLRGGSQVKFRGQTRRIVRGLNSAKLCLPNDKRLRIISTHLDHMNESERAAQIDHVVELVDTDFCKDDLIILAGDLNALKQADYSKLQWKILEDRARENDWSMPTDCIALNKLCDVGLQDSFITGTITESEFTAHVGSPMYRIDYVYSRGLHVVKSFVDQSVKVSDHYPVIVDFEDNKKNDILTSSSSSL
jgi:endonuclease/exonuclease/phosphatase family metal-dependent hydrolase